MVLHIVLAHHDNAAKKGGAMEDPSSLFSLVGKNAVIIGGAGGIGHGIGEAYVRSGANVALADINTERLEQAKKEIEAVTSRRIWSYYVDCRQEESVRELAGKVLADVGPVNILVNAQGINFKASAVEFPIDEWDSLFATNVRGVMIPCKVFGAEMVKQGGGKIISLSSVRGQRGALGGNSGYCATKGAVDMITRQLACELATKNVCVNALGPTMTVTPMTEQRYKDEPERYARMLQNVPMGRKGTLGDLVGPAIFLASAASDFVTGTTLYPDGGQMAFV